MDRPSDMWAWAHESADEPPTPVDAGGVLAVLVAHNGEQWLPRTLIALARLDARPGGLVAVDAGSRDSSRRLLEEARDQGIVDVVLDGRAADGFGANVGIAVRQAAEHGLRPTWLWLLHDDSAPRRTCLSELLRAAGGAAGASPAILVPKLLRPKRRNHPDQMSAVGESIAPSGMRVLTVEPGDIDQHQQEPAAVLGASTAGLLVRMDAWRALGGLSPEIPLFRDGVDLGWRANARGLSVRTCPEAVLRHIEAGRVGLRDSTLAPDPHRADRLAGMSVVAMHARRPGRAVVRLCLQSVASSVGFLLGKSPSLAASRLGAAVQLGRSRGTLIAANARVREQASGEVASDLLPDRAWGIRRFFDRTAGAISDRYYDLVDDDDGGLDELTGDDFAGGRQRFRLWSPAIIGMLVMLLVSLVASRHLFHAGFLRGAALLPAPPTLGDAWANWVQATAGMAGSNAPWLGVMSLGSTLAFGQPDWFATLLVLGGPALAAWAAFHFLRPVTGPGWWTPMLACLWGTMLPVLEATANGSMDAVIVAVGLPILGSVLRRWATADTRGAEGWRLPASVALVGTVWGGFMPSMLLVTGIAGAWMAVWRRDLRGGLVAVLGAPIALGAWVPRLVSDPGRLLVGSDPGATLAGRAPSGLEILTGSAHQPGTPLAVGLVVVAIVWAAGIAGAIRSGAIRPGTRRLLYLAVAFGPASGVALSRLVVPVAGVTVRPDPTPWVLVGLFGLLAFAASGLGRWSPGAPVDPAPAAADHGGGVRAREVLGGMLMVALAVGATWWAATGTSQLERRTDGLPSYVTGIEGSARATRTLLIDLTGATAHFSVTSATSPAWGTAEVPVLSANREAGLELGETARQIAQGQPSDDLASRLAKLGIGHVWLRGANAQAVSNLSSVTSLGVAQVDDATVVLTVTTLPSHVALRQGGTETPIDAMTVSGPAPGALVVVSEPVDPGWRASIAGHQLTAASSGDWRQAWDVGGRSGELRIWRRADVASVAWLTIGILILIVLAAPTAQRANAPRRALSGQGRRAGGGGGRR